MFEKDLIIARKIFKDNKYNRLFQKDKDWVLFGSNYRLFRVKADYVHDNEIKFFDDNKTNDTMISTRIINQNFKPNTIIEVNKKDIDKKSKTPHIIVIDEYHCVKVNPKYLYDLLEWCRTDKILIDNRTNKYTDDGIYKGLISAQGGGWSGADRHGLVCVII